VTAITANVSGVVDSGPDRGLTELGHYQRLAFIGQIAAAPFW
jgi:hypothetical protein